MPNKINKRRAVIGVIVDVVLITVCLPGIVIILGLPTRGPITAVMVGGFIGVLISGFNKWFFPDTYRLYMRDKADRKDNTPRS